MSEGVPSPPDEANPYKNLRISLGQEILKAQKQVYLFIKNLTYSVSYGNILLITVNRS